jgi:hypothetical protein
MGMRRRAGSGEGGTDREKRAREAAQAAGEERTEEVRRRTCDDD